MNPLYFQDSYLKEFSSVVTKVNENNSIELENTAFYPKSGGQEHDTGVLIRNNEEFPVTYTGKSGEIIFHELSKTGLQVGDKVVGKINWDRRYKHMRSHTSAHIISAIIHNKLGALITGNQITEEKVRIDFNTENYDPEQLKGFVDQTNKIIELDLPTKSYFISKEEVEKDPALSKLAKGLPQDLTEFRIVEIGQMDKQVDGGTHVKSTKEIGTLEFIKADNRGKNNRRLYYKLIESHN